MGSALVVPTEQTLATVQTTRYSVSQLATICSAVMKSPAGRPPTVEELQLLAYVSDSTGLDWFKKELGIARWSNNPQAPLEPYISYEGEFTLASRAVPLVGHEMYWMGREPDAQWRDVWLDDEWGTPAAAKCVLWIKGNSHPVVATAPWGTWARGQLVDEMIPDPDGGTEERPFEEWEDVKDADGRVMRHPEGHARAGRPKRIKATKWKEVPKMIYTGRKVIEPVPGSMWHDKQSFAIGKQALKLAAKYARRMSGQPDQPPPVDDSGVRKMREWAFALLRELGRENDREYRYQLSDGVSWAVDGGLDIEDWARILSDLRVQVELKRIADGQPRLTAEEVNELFNTYGHPTQDLTADLERSIKATSKDVQGSPAPTGPRADEAEPKSPADAEGPPGAAGEQAAPPKNPSAGPPPNEQDVDPPGPGKSRQEAGPGPGPGGVPTVPADEEGKPAAQKGELMASDEQLERVDALAAALGTTAPNADQLTAEGAERIIDIWTKEYDKREGKK